MTQIKKTYQEGIEAFENDEPFDETAFEAWQQGYADAREYDYEERTK